MNRSLELREAPHPPELPDDVVSFLESLDGPTAWRVPGRDRSRCRIVTTLLHGNEPSGLIAVHDWLRSGREPAVDAICVLGNVEAAQVHPVFTQRSVPGRSDLNRCFLGPWDDIEGDIARQLLDLIAQTSPEAVIDVHNNTGHNPPYAIGTHPTREALELSSLFSRDFIWSHLELGALIEGVTACPAVTIEVGKSHEAAADRVATEGIARFFEVEAVFDVASRAALDRIRILTMPMRARLVPGRKLVMGQRPADGADLTMPDDLDRHNFEDVPPGSRIGWVNGQGCPLELIDEYGANLADDYFERRGDELVARRSFMPIMITVDAEVAASDCLFYVVQHAEHDASSS